MKSCRWAKNIILVARRALPYTNGLEENKAKGYIRKSTTPTAAPVFIVKRKDDPREGFVDKSYRGHTVFMERQKKRGETFKTKFTKAPLLAHLDKVKSIYVETHASDVAVGCLCPRKREMNFYTLWRFIVARFHQQSTIMTSTIKNC